MITLYTTGFCAPCRRARQVLDYAAAKTGASFREVNVSDHPDEALTLGITSTPTIRAEDGTQFVGVPTLAQATEMLRGTPDRAG